MKNYNTTFLLFFRENKAFLLIETTITFQLDFNFYNKLIKANF